ncbi:MAG: hypothetical protein A2W82_04850 [Sulfurimonas sp. RIFCSPLOWO2_12_36_12]|uniref:hypothetical protein n=1 Tax=Sulfurimonas sp. RIFCSPLOWO2_12_36_12 TaxID=1802253 RepID=UPI0008D0FBF4|nr:hypothetical protein [Sulfurimonas sp. RIFCSPLOWO2_12_36_12]OHD86424.1 MAG: hypothetical protein A2Y52_03015 [Sulfuricurvum sp. RIFCSPLOWO2_02_43_6]OHE00691.1 MAG: hypothetical protein A3J26_05355 [Sulfurimonas sp. RIFCSPLOWO2_02_FULL_36_28]OHE02020.1 MAG: hypothetical protein A2W82_04850 [Sulfurimonas sp. RIFCSPLOWO2_12_36_12]
MQKNKIKYHPKILKLFAKDELDTLAEKAFHSVDDDGFVNIIVVCTDKISVEIFVSSEEHALIERLDSEKVPNRLTKEEFWDIFSRSKAQEIRCVVID